MSLSPAFPLKSVLSGVLLQTKLQALPFFLSITPYRSVEIWIGVTDDGRKISKNMIEVH